MAQKKPPVRVKKHNNHTAAGILFALPWIIGFLAFSLYPIVMSVYYSLTDFNMFQAPKFVGLENYTALFQDEKFYKSLWNTMYMTVLGTPLCLLVGLLMALLLNQKVRGMPVRPTQGYARTARLTHGCMEAPRQKNSFLSLLLILAASQLIFNLVLRQRPTPGYTMCP